MKKILSLKIKKHFWSIHGLILTPYLYVPTFLLWVVDVSVIAGTKINLFFRSSCFTDS